MFSELSPISIESQGVDLVAHNATSCPPLLSKAQWELVEICVRATQVFGAPRSVGEIFGFLFAKSDIASFEQIVEALGISAGSASHGLKYLRRLGAVKIVFRARDRRDYFQIEASLQKIVAGFMSETAFFHLGGISDRIDRLRMRLEETDGIEAREINDRLNLLWDWSQQAKSALALALGAIR